MNSSNRLSLLSVRQVPAPTRCGCVYFRAMELLCRLIDRHYQDNSLDHYSISVDVLNIVFSYFCVPVYLLHPPSSTYLDIHDQRISFGLVTEDPTLNFTPACQMANM